MKTNKFTLGIILISSIIFPILFGSCKDKKDKDGSEEIPEIDVAYPLSDSVVIHKNYPATLTAADNADVVAQVNGRILTKNYESGAYVKKGDILFTIDASLYRDDVARTNATLQSAKGALEYALQEYEAMQQAYKSDAVAKMDLIKSQSALQQAKANVSDALAALESSKTNLSYCTVRAPISGYISSANYSVGSYVAGEGSPVILASIYDEEVFNVVFDIEESEYSRILTENGGKDNSIFRSVPLDFPGKLPHRYTCDITYSAPAVNPSTGSLTIMGRVANINNELKEGMYCQVLMPSASIPQALLVNDASIGTDQLGKYIYVLNDSDRVETRHIETVEIYQDSLRVVLSGIDKKDRYVTKALLNVRNGMKVNPKIAGVKK